jgi:hypothetical protein
VLVVDVVWHNSSRGLTSSFVLERPVFAPSIILTTSLALVESRLVLVGP